MNRHTCSFAYFIEYALFFLDDNVYRKTPNVSPGLVLSRKGFLMSLYTGGGVGGGWRLIHGTTFVLITTTTFIFYSV